MEKLENVSGFLSYARDDNHEGYITRLHQKLSDEICSYLGSKISIFQDLKIGKGQQWESRINESINGSTFFILSSRHGLCAVKIAVRKLNYFWNTKESSVKTS
jgi:hypothetical protein